MKKKKIPTTKINKKPTKKPWAGWDSAEGHPA